MWELNYKESWTPKNWCFWTVVLEKTLESPLGCKEIQPVHPKGNLSWIFIGRTDAEAETPILWPPDVKSWLICKDPDDGKDWRQEEKGTTGWDGWMASPTQWVWVWVNSGRWWWTGRPGMLHSMRWQKVGHEWAPEWNWTNFILSILFDINIATLALFWLLFVWCIFSKYFIIFISIKTMPSVKWLNWKIQLKWIFKKNIYLFGCALLWHVNS